MRGYDRIGSERGWGVLVYVCVCLGVFGGRGLEDGYGIEKNREKREEDRGRNSACGCSNLLLKVGFLCDSRGAARGSNAVVERKQRGKAGMGVCKAGKRVGTCLEWRCWGRFGRR